MITVFFFPQQPMLRAVIAEVDVHLGNMNLKRFVTPSKSFEMAFPLCHFCPFTIAITR